MAKIDPTDSALTFRRIPYTFRRWSVKDKDLTAPPGAPEEGDRYIVGAGATGAWSGHDGEIAEYHAAGAEAITWIFETPWMGYRTYVEDETEFYFWNGTAWGPLSGAISTSHTHYYEKHVVTAGEASSQVITLIVGTYTPGDNSLEVVVERSKLCVTEDYTETDSSTVTFLNDELEEGNVIIFRWWK